MKKAVGFAIGFSLLVSPLLAFADVAPSTVGNGDPMNLGMPWGLAGYQTPVVKNGSLITDEHGYTMSCAFFQGCFDITHTDYYRQQMFSIATQLKKLGYSGGMFGGWIAAVQ